MTVVVRRSINPDSMQQPVEYNNSDGHHSHHDEEIDCNRKRNRHYRTMFFGEKCSTSRIACSLCLAVQVALFAALIWNHQNAVRGMISPILQVSASSADLVHNQDNINNATKGHVDDETSQQQQCTLPKPPRPRKGWTTKPILIPGYPSYFHESHGIGNGDFIQPLIQHLTGLEQGARNFHASSKTLKRCHTASSETITCSQIHPIVDINPQRHANLFHSNVILAIQNFAIAFPMSASIKSNRYSGTIGQATIDDWRKTRDLYLQEAFIKWKSVITTWKKESYYKIVMYLPYEHLMDSIKGPVVIQRLAKQLELADFDTVNLTTTTTTDLLGTTTSSAAAALQCIWKRSIQGTIQFEKSYIKYKPAYTLKQRDYMLEQMQQFIDEILGADNNKNDMELIAILQEYHDEIQNTIPVEEEESNSSIGVVSTTTA